jgi:hypothetical protein
MSTDYGKMFYYTNSAKIYFSFLHEMNNTLEFGKYGVYESRNTKGDVISISKLCTETHPCIHLVSINNSSPLEIKANEIMTYMKDNGFAPIEHFKDYANYITN